MIENMQQINSQSLDPKITGFGLRLKTAREAANLSEKDAAARLNLSVKFIDIMEEENFAAGLPATFMRGYLRSYARMLNISDLDIDKAIAELGMNMNTNTQNATVNTPKLHAPSTYDSERFMHWVTYLIMLVLVILVGVWWHSESRETGITNKAINKPKPIIKSQTNKTSQSPAPSMGNILLAKPAAPLPSPYKAIEPLVPKSALPPSAVKSVQGANAVKAKQHRYRRRIYQTPESGMYRGGYPGGYPGEYYY